MRSQKKSRNKIKKTAKKRSSLTLLLFLLLLAVFLLYLVSQKMSADAVTTAGTTPTNTEVGTINYSIRVVDKKDITKPIPNQAVTVYTNGSTSMAENLTSDGNGLISGGTFSICTKDSNLYTIMTKGCGQKVTKITLTMGAQSATTTSKTIRRNNTKKFTIPVSSTSYIVPQFKEKFVAVAGGTTTATTSATTTVATTGSTATATGSTATTATTTTTTSGISGKWSMPTSLLYSDGSGVKVMENTLSNTKSYEVGTVDLSITVADKKDSAKNITGQSASIQPASVTYRTVKKLFSKKTVATPTNLPSLNTTATADASGLITAGHYLICVNGKLRYYIMDTGCKNRIDRLSITLAGSKKTVSQNLNKSGNGYAASDILKLLIKKDGSSLSGITGDLKTKNSIILYSDGSGGKTI